MNAPSLKWRARAKAEFEALISYIAQDNPDAAQELRNEFLIKVGMLPLHPRLYRSGQIADTREMVIRRNYIVVYTETAEVVTVLRVIHAARQWP